MSLKRSKACVLILSAVAMLPITGSAQTPGKKVFTTSHPKVGGYENNGLKAAVTSITRTEKGFAVQLQVENTKSNPILASPISSNDGNGSGETALSASGRKLMIDGNGHSFVGMDPCYIMGYGLNYSSAVSACAKTPPVDNMTRLEPGQPTLLGITYVGTGDLGANVSFTLKFVVRDVSSSESGEDTLSSKPTLRTKTATSISSLSFSQVPLPDAPSE